MLVFFLFVFAATALFALFCVSWCGCCLLCSLWVSDTIVMILVVLLWLVLGERFGLLVLVLLFEQCLYFEFVCLEDICAVCVWCFYGLFLFVFWCF